MAFKAAFIAHAPDADPEEHGAVIDTGKYKLYVVVVRDQEQALDAAGALVEREGVHSILLCPGFTHKDIAEIAEAVGPDISVCVARGDSPSNKAVAEIMRREWA